MTDEEIIIEVRRRGRRSRFHRGARQSGTGVRLDPPQCNIDDAADEVRILDALPVGMQRPWSRLCRRCWRDSTELAEATRLRSTYLTVRERAALGRMLTRVLA